jgi:hypothetical protein
VWWQAAGIAITHVVPHTFYNGDYPVQRLQEHNHGGFDVKVRLAAACRARPVAPPDVDGLLGWLGLNALVVSC